jgi:hypothetical protein
MDGWFRGHVIVIGDEYPEMIDPAFAGRAVLTGRS